MSLHRWVFVLQKLLDVIHPGHSARRLPRSPRQEWVFQSIAIRKQVAKVVLPTDCTRRFKAGHEFRK